jgi:hypothetical protein
MSSPIISEERETPLLDEILRKAAEKLRTYTLLSCRRHVAGAHGLTRREGSLPTTESQ